MAVAMLLLSATGAFAAAATPPDPDQRAAVQTARERLATALAAEPGDSQAGLDALDALGAALSKARQYDEALAVYQRAADMAKRLRSDKHPLYAAYLYDVADVLEDMDRLPQARDTFIEAAQLFADHYGLKHSYVARSLEAVGRVAARLDEQVRAEAAYRLALKSRSALDGPDAPTTLLNVERLSAALGALGRSADAYELLRSTLDRPETPANADVRVDLSLQLGHAALLTDRYDEAYRLVTQVLKHREAELGAGHTKTLRAKRYLANTLGQMGRWPESLALYEAIHQAYLQTLGPDDSATLAAAGSRAFTLAAMGRYVQALAIEEDVAQRTEKALGADSIEAQGARLAASVTLRKLGRLAEAGLLQERLARTALDKFGLKHPFTAAVVDALAATNRDLGRWAKSAELGQLVIDAQLHLNGPQHRDTLAARHDRALNLIKLGQLQEAHDTVSAAIAVIDTPDKKHPSLPHLGHYYRTLGETELQMGRRGTAAASLRRALVLTEQAWGVEHPLTGNVLVYLAQAVDDPADRAAIHARALRLGRAAEFPEVVWRAADGLRAAYADLGNRPLAVLYGKQAINAVQALRKNIGNLSQGLQKTFLDEKRGVYLQTADLLIAEGRLSEGQQVLAMLKEEEYYEFVSRSSGDDATASRLSLNAQEAAWQQRYAAVSERLVEISKRKAALDAQLRTGSLSDDEKALRTRYEGDLKAAREAFDAAMRQIAEESRRLAANAGGQKLGTEVLDSVRAMRSDLRQLGHGAVLVHYLMARDKLWILLTTPEVQVARESKVAAADLNRLIAALRNALRNPRSNAQVPAQDLYRWLLAPIAADLAQAQAKTLMLSLDGALRYVPFAALHDGQRYAVEQWRFAILTEAAKSKIKDAPQAEWSMTGLGLTKAVAGFAALPAVREELGGLVRAGGSGQGDAAAGGAGVMPGEALFDEAFTVDRVKAVLGDPHPVLHIASHFKFTPGTEADSYLVMGDGGKLSLQQIRQDDLQFNVDLLTLSACETAVGDNALGTEVEGLGALAQKQGAKAVLATLWPVADASTGLFMREMYRRRGADKLTKAEAIRQVQLAFLRGELQGAGGADRGARVAGSAAAPMPAAPAEGYAHPFYWAPFILMGNWL